MDIEFIGMVSMIPLQQNNLDIDVNDVYQLYQSTLDTIGPSMFEVIFNGDWQSRTGIPDANNNRQRDFHPTPLEHLEYCQQVFPEFDISSNTQNWIANINQQLLDGQDVAWSYSTNTPKRL